MKYIIFSLLLIVALIGIFLIPQTTHKKLPNTKAGLVVSVPIVVSVVNESQGEGQVLTVYSGDKSFDWDELNKMHKHCVGITTPETIRTTCEIIDNKIQIIHFVNSSYNKSENLCLYIDLDNQECRLGDTNTIYYSEDEVKQIHQ